MNNTDSITVREKTTAGIPFTLYSEDVPLNVSSSQYISWNMIDGKGKVYRYSTLLSGSILVVNSGTLGYVTLTPPNEDVFKYDRSPYRGYCWVYITSAQKYSVPRDSYVTINVLREY